MQILLVSLRRDIIKSSRHFTETSINNDTDKKKPSYNGALMQHPRLFSQRIVLFCDWFLE